MEQSVLQVFSLLSVAANLYIYFCYKLSFTLCKLFIKGATLRNSALVAPEVSSMFIGTMGIFSQGFSFTPSVLFLGVEFLPSMTKWKLTSTWIFLWQNM
jgi:hypothetical protein